jgi:4-amino-4-deoxy-L-arabinose transferase-like glycosyltransferase
MPSRPAGRPASSSFARHGALLAVVLVLVFTSFVRLRLADGPLERDEGEYAYAGQLILEGLPPYALAYNMKFPGTYYAYSAMLALFGHTAWGIRAGLAGVNAATTILLFFLARRVLGTASGAAVAASAFALLSVDRWVAGPLAHATHFVLLPAVGGLLVLLRAFESNRWSTFLMAGMLFGTAVLMKQHGAAFLLLAAALIIWFPRRQAAHLSSIVRRIAVVGLGALLPFAVLCLVFAAQGVLGRFWFWTFDYAKEYVSQVQLWVGLAVLRAAVSVVTTGMWALWLLAGLGFAGLWVVRWPREPRVFMTLFAATSFLAVCPGLLFRDHYFILILPALAMCAGAAVVSVSRLLATAMPQRAALGAALALAIAASAHGIVSGREWMFRLTGTELSRAMYQANPFPEAVRIGEYLAAHTAPGDRIAVLGSEPEIYFYARRKSATGYIYMYPFGERQAFAARMRAEFVREVEDARPTYVVLAAIGSSWTENPAGDQTAFDWARRYVRTCYEPVGVADIGEAHTTMVWDAEAVAYRPSSPYAVYTLRRKHDGPCSVPQ